MTPTNPRPVIPDPLIVVIGLAVQALIEKLVASGTLDGDDLADMRSYGLQFVADLTAYRSARIPGGTAGLEHRIMSWWDQLNTPALHANDP